MYAVCNDDHTWHWAELWWGTGAEAGECHVSRVTRSRRGGQCWHNKVAVTREHKGLAKYLNTSLSGHFPAPSAAVTRINSLILPSIFYLPSSLCTRTLHYNPAHVSTVEHTNTFSNEVMMAVSMLYLNVVPCAVVQCDLWVTWAAVRAGPIFRKNVK